MRDFIQGALLEFERADFRKVPGKPPTAYFYDQHGGNSYRKNEKVSTFEISPHYRTVPSGFAKS